MLLTNQSSAFAGSARVVRIAADPGEIHRLAGDGSLRGGASRARRTLAGRDILRVFDWRATPTWLGSRAPCPGVCP